MLILEVMLAILAVIAIVFVLVGFLFFTGIVIAKISEFRSNKKLAQQQALYPDYYEKLAVYDEKYGIAARFQAEHIDAKKTEIDELEKEIKYLPAVHVTVQLEKIAKLKQEIYDNGWKFKKMVEEYTLLNTELISLRKKYAIDT